MITGAFHRRYPDLVANRQGLAVEGKETVLLCFSGNRSSELCEKFTKEGVACYFMIGGYEKWLAEGRPVDGKKISLKELRTLPDFRGKDVLLDTPEVEKLVSRKSALFVDVRYPGDFAAGHLPGAVNIPLRKMLSEEMWETLKGLPKDRPIIAPCYDKRSSFYALILGLRLDRLGHEFCGRYTVPHEYVSSPHEREYVKAWRQQQDATFLGLIGKPIHWLLYRLQKKTGSFLLTIFLTVLLLRLLLLPFSVKMEIDRIREKKRAPQVAKLKEKLKDQPRRLARALQSIAREDRVTPVYNMVGNILQMVLFLVLFSVVSGAARKFGGDLFWMKPISSPDPWCIMPVLVAGMIFLHMLLGTPKPSRAQMALFVTSTGIIFLLTVKIAGALNIYLSMSIGLLIIHGAVVRGLYRWRECLKASPPAQRRSRKNYSGIIPLRYLDREAGGGNKALKLADMIKADFPVPDGFVIVSYLLEKGEVTEADKRKIWKAWTNISAKRVAVRSSGLNEDGAEKSYAGVFESILEVTWENFFDALEEVSASLSSVRAAAYSGREEFGGVVVQKMVNAEYAGVMFTEHPGTSGSMMIEVVEGLGESLVSGQVTPEPYQFGRYSGQPMFEGSPPIDLAPLIELGRAVERHFKVPQDIEWAYAKGKFYLLQTRDITSDSRRNAGQKGVFERERFRLLELFKERGAGEVVLRQNELSELLPRPSRFSLSMMERIWEPGGTVDLACSRMGIPYHVEEESDPYVVTAFGALYVNCGEEKKRMGKGPGAIATFRLSRAAEAIEREFREEFLPDYLGEIQLRESLELGRLSLLELVKLFRRWEREFVCDVYVQAEVINLAAEYYMQVAKQELLKREKNPAEYLGQLPETVVHRAMSLLPLIRSGERDLHDFLNLFGHRAPHDFEISMPRYRENLTEIMQMVSRSTDKGAKTEEGEVGFQDRILNLTVGRARRFQVLKEEAKHHSLRLYALLRGLLVEMDQRLMLSGGIYDLEVEEVLRLGDASFVNQAFTLVENRRNESIFDEGGAPPIDFCPKDLEKFGLNLELGVSGGDETEVLRGLRISGVGEGVGRVRVINSPEELDLFEKGEILVSRFTDPTWTPLFSLAAGVITEVGGWLSHAAIVAREMNLVGIVNVRNATQQLKTGDFVRLHEDGTVALDKRNRRKEKRFSVDRTIVTFWDGLVVDIRLVDISRSGARIELESSMVKEVERLVSGLAQLEPDRGRINFTVIHRDGNTFGIQFETLLEESTIAYLRQDRAELFGAAQNSGAEQTQLLVPATELHSEGHFKTLIRKIVSSATAMLNAERSLLFIYDEKSRELRSLVAEGIGNREIRFPSYLGIAGAAFTNGETLNVPDAYADPRFNSEIDRKTNCRTGSILCVPILKDGECMGVIQALNKLGDSFNIVDENRLKSFAEQVAVALENARLYDEAMQIKAYSESIMDTISEGVITLDREDRVVGCNNASLRIFGMGHDELVGQDVNELFASTSAMRESAEENGEAADRMDKKVIHCGDRQVEVNLKTIPLLDSFQDSVGSMIVVSE